jgi:hypothetical protein
MKDSRDRTDDKRRKRILAEVAAGRTHCDAGHAITARSVSKRGYCYDCERDKRDRLATKARRRAAAKKQRISYKRSTHCRNGHRRAKKNTDRRGSCRICIRTAINAREKRKRLDSAYAEDRREYQRIYGDGRRRAAGVKPRNWGPKSKRVQAQRRRDDNVFLPVEPFLGWLSEWLRFNPEQRLGNLCRAAGSTERSVLAWRTGERGHIQIGLVDRFLVAAGEPPNLLDVLYPLDSHEYAVSA